MPSSHKTGPDTNRPNAPIWLKILVFWHVICITVWALPNPSNEILEGKVAAPGTDKILLWNYQNKMRDPLRQYLYLTGFWQYWDMFCPDPASVDIWFDAEVVYQDGTSKIYKYPRMADLSIPEKYEKERYRKFYERINNPEFSRLWSVFGQYIAHLMDDPSNPPKIIRFRRHFQKVPPPGEKMDDKYQQEQYFEYVVDAEKLKAER